MISIFLSEHSKENDHLLGYLFKTLANMNDVQLNLSPQENRQIHQHILERTNTNQSLWIDKKRAPFIPTNTEAGDNDSGDVVQFNCYLKSFGSTLVILLVPSTVKDVKKLLGNDLGKLITI